MAISRPLSTLATHARWLYPVGVIILAIIFGSIFGLGLALLIVAGGVLGGSIWLIWSSLQGLGGDMPITLEEALSLGAPSAEEEQKRAVLRALKDLEYERAVGKINEADYASLAEHYRNEAKRLLRAVDRDLTPERERAEQLLAERLAALGMKPGAAPKRDGEGSDESGSGARPKRSGVDGGAPAKAASDDADDGDEEAVHAKSPSSDTAV